MHRNGSFLRKHKVKNKTWKKEQKFSKFITIDILIRFANLRTLLKLITDLRAIQTHDICVSVVLYDCSVRPITRCITPSCSFYKIQLGPVPTKKPTRNLTDP